VRSMDLFATDADARLSRLAVCSMKSWRASTGIWSVAIFTMLAPRIARADGGIVQLREAQGPFLITVFVSPEAVEGGLTDVSVLFKQRKSGDVILDANVSLAVDAPADVLNNESDPLCGLSPTAVSSRLPESAFHLLQVRATREQASNKLLYASPLNLDVPGDW